MMPNSFAWDVELIEELFCARDIDEILRIPLVRNISGDKCIWAHSKDGTYTVKSRYRRAMQVFNDDTDFRVSGDWRKIWKLNIPPKIRTFAWQAARCCLPTRENLQRRGIDVPITCVLCGRDIENNWHLMISCPFTQSCWQEAGLSQLINSCAERSDSFFEWIFQVLSATDEAEVNRVLMIMWSIWRCRNDKFWKNTTCMARDIIFAGLNYLCNWLGERHHAPGEMQNWKESNFTTIWKRPPTKLLKCNTDASLSQDSNTTGFGMILRNELEGFVACRTKSLSGVLTVAEAEAMCLLKAMQWIESMGLKDVIFETDAKQIVDAMEKPKEDFSEFGLLIFSCRSILNNDNSF
ncbi:hypothetical protein DITRI_Ditri03aG0079200 [Diplodiscus trichospermus]